MYIVLQMVVLLTDGCMYADGFTRGCNLWQMVLHVVVFHADGFTDGGIADIPGVSDPYL